MMCQQWAGGARSFCRGWGARCDSRIVLKASGRGGLGGRSQPSEAMGLSQQLVGNLSAAQGSEKVKSQN